MDQDQSDKPKRSRSRRALVVRAFYSEPEQPRWKMTSREWGTIEDKASLDIPPEVRAIVHESVLDYFYERDRELSAFDAADVSAYVAKVRDAAILLSLLLSSETDSKAIIAARDMLREELINPLDPAFDPLSHRTACGEIDFDAAEAAIDGANQLGDAARIVERIAEAADIMLKQPTLPESHPGSLPESLKPEKPSPAAWQTMVREIARAFRAAGLPIGVKKDTRKGASQFTDFMLALTRTWPERYRQFNTGLDGEESMQAMATAINEAKKSAGGD